MNKVLRKIGNELFGSKTHKLSLGLAFFFVIFLATTILLDIQKGKVHAAIVVDNKSSSNSSNQQSITWSHTVSSGLSNSLLVVGVSINKSTSNSVQSVTWNSGSESFSRAVSFVSTSGMQAEIWYLKAPTAGTYNIVATLTGAPTIQGWTVGAVSFSGVDQNDPIPTTATSSTFSSVSISTSYVNSYIMDTMSYDTTTSLTADGPQAQEWFESTSNVSGGGSVRPVSSTGSYSMSWSGTSDNWAQVAVEIKSANPTDSLFIQSKSAGGNGTAPSITLDATPTQDDLLVAAVFSATNSTITMTSGGWTALTSLTSGSGNSALATRMFYKIAGASESTTVTASTTSADYVIEVAEYSSINTSSPLNVENVQANASGTAQPTPSVSPTGGGNILIVAFSGDREQDSFSNETVNSSTTGVTEREDINAGGSSIATGALYDKIVSSPSGSYSGSADAASGQYGAGAIAIFNNTSNSAPSAPSMASPAQPLTGATGLPLTGYAFKARSADPDGDYLQYEFKVYDSSNCTSTVMEDADQTSSQTGWSGQDADSSQAYAGNSTESSSTMAVHAYGGTTLTANTTYSWQARAYDPGGSQSWGNWGACQSFTTSHTPSAPTLSKPADSSTGIPTIPVFRLSSTDSDNDYLEYKIEFCGTSSDCSSISHTIDQTSSQTGWSSQSQNLGAAYSSGQTAVYDYQFSDLTSNTQYWWRAYAIDPGGSDTWSSASAIHSFTTQDLSSSSERNIRFQGNICFGSCN